MLIYTVLSQKLQRVTQVVGLDLNILVYEQILLLLWLNFCKIHSYFFIFDANLFIVSILSLLLIFWWFMDGDIALKIGIS